MNCAQCKAEYRKRMVAKYGEGRGRGGFGPVALGAAITPPAQQALLHSGSQGQSDSTGTDGGRSG